MYSASRYLTPITLCVITHDQDNRDRWVSPFGNLRVKGCSHLTAAYRIVPRPSSPVCAKASTNCPYLTLESPHHQRQRWVNPKANQNSAEQQSRSILVRMIKMLSLIISTDLLDPARRTSLHRPNRCRTASILRTHSQCQTGSHAPIISARRRRTGVFISRKLLEWWSLSGSNR